MSSTPNTSCPPSKPEQFLDERSALSCVHCGLCLAACPTYLETGNENLSPRGRVYLMRQIQSGRSALDELAVGPLDSCLGCLACQPACPAGVHYGELLETTRDFIEHNHRRSLFQVFLRRIFIEQIFPYPWRMRLATAPVKYLRHLGIERFFPKFLHNALALLPSEVEEIEALPEFSAATTASRGRVGFITGCVQSVFFSATNAASVRLLNRAGYDVVTPFAQGCCGAIYSHGGQLAKALNCARRNIAAFEAEELDYIVIAASGCGSTLKDYGHLLKDDPKWAGRGKAFAAKMRDLVELLPPGMFQPQPVPGSSLVTYHDACHLANPQGIRQQPRDLVKAACGGNFVELPETELCCGSAGTYNLTQPDMAAQLQRRKIGNIIKTGAKTVVTTNPGCLLQIRAGLRQAGCEDIEALHIADYLERQSAPGD